MRIGSTWAILALAVNALVWGVSWWPFRQLEAEGLHPLWATGIMYALVLIPLSLYRPRVWAELIASKGLWLLALSAGFTNASFNWAVTLGDVVRVVLLFYLMPAWALILARWLLNEPITRNGALRLALAVTGVLLVLKTPGSSRPLPQSLSDWLAIAGGATFALTNILLRKLDQTTESARLHAMFAGGAVIALLVAGLGNQVGVITALPAPSWQLLLTVMAMGVMFLIGNLALQYGASRLSSSTTSLVMLTEIIFATFSSVLLGASVLELRILWGALLILAASVWAALD
jgi:drug/metabolite transporter (DMT)-like permease